MSNIVRVAVTETRNVADIARSASRLEEIRRANVEHHIALIQVAAAAGAQVVGLGELFPAPYFALEQNPVWLDLAEDARDGPTVSALRETARHLGVILIAPIFELDSGSGKRFNTAVVIDGEGALLGSYRKVHIPSGSNEQGAFCETFYYERSDGRLHCTAANISTHPFFPVFRTAVGNVAVAICYDRHFEGVMSTLARQGAQLVFSPAVTFGARSRRLWRLEFAVDAARHKLFIAASNRKGKEPPFAVEYFGDSHVVGPNGELTNRSAHPELVIADVDLGELQSGDGSGWDLARDARPDLYR